MTKKKTIILISVILGVFLLGLLGYYLVIRGGGEDTGGGITSIFRNFFPFGGEELPPYTTPTENVPGEGGTSPQENYIKKLRLLSPEPVAGAGTLDVSGGTEVNYIEKATGHIYRVELFSPNRSRISNTTIPLVYDAIWGDNNGSLIARYLKEDNYTVDTYSLSVKNLSRSKATSTESTIAGTLFPAGISDVSVLGNSLFYLEQKENSSSGFISSFDGKSSKQIWNSPIKELLSQYVNGRTVALTTKPGKNIPGYLYFIDTSTAISKLIIGGISGLSTLVDPTASKILYISLGNTSSMNLYDNQNNVSTLITPTTFPEKCVWSKKDLNIVYCAVSKSFLSPDSLISWYKGLTSFEDDIWKYHLKNKTSSLIENLTADAGEPIDVIKPILSEGEQYLVFINKVDNKLWSLDLTK